MDSNFAQDAPAQLARHADHDPSLICRPAGYGLCEPWTVTLKQYTARETEIAQVVHETIRSLQDVQGDEAPSPPWSCASEHVRAACLDGVRRAMAGETPEQHHEAWCEFKRAAGWTCGPVKDEQARTHPCLVPYGQLPREQQVKNQVFLAIVRALTARAA